MSALVSRRLIVNADDFGRSHAINHAVYQAHREGILTSASLMVNGGAFDEAVELARAHPRLGVGLHLTLVCGRSTLAPSAIPGLVDKRNNFSDNPVGAGWRYFVNRSLVPQLEREIAAQFDKFRRTGLALDHVNGHLNMHLHPTVFGLLLARAESWGLRALRLTRDPFWLNARLAGGRWVYRASHAFLYGLLVAWARRALPRRGIRHTSRVFGLLQNGRLDERYLTRLLRRLPGGDSELYSHPSLDEFRHELDAFLSSEVKALIARQHIKLIRYQDL